MKRSLIALSLFMIIVPLVLALPPSVKNVYTLPQNPTLGNDLECTFNYTDTQNYVEQNSNYQWWKNSVNQGINNRVLGKNNLTATDSWYCKITPFNGLEYGTQNQSINTVTVTSTVKNPNFFIDQELIWNNSGYYGEKQTLYGFEEKLQQAVDGCIPDAQGFCDLTLTFTSEDTGSINVTDMEIYYKTYTRPTVILQNPANNSVFVPESLNILLNFTVFDNGTDPFTVELYGKNGTANTTKLESVWTDFHDPDFRGQAEGITSDRENNIIVTGVCPGCSDDDPFNLDIYTYKLDTDGSLLWRKLNNKTVIDRPHGVAVDSSSNVYVTGECTGCGSNGSSAFYTFKLNASGIQQWESIIDPSPSTDQPGDLAVDTEDNIIVGGRCNSCFQQSYLIKYYPNGTVRWTKNFNPVTSDDYIEGISTDSNNNIYLTGACTTCTMSGSEGIYVVKLDSTGTVQWTDISDITAFADYSIDIDIDTQNNIFVSGYCSGCGDKGGTAIYVMKMYPNATHIWNITNDPTSSSDQGNAITTDNESNVYVTGQCSGCGNVGGYAIYTIMLLVNGTVISSNVSDFASGEDYGSAIDADNNNDVVVAGYCNNCLQGGSAFYTTKFNPTTRPLPYELLYSNDSVLNNQTITYNWSSISKYGSYTWYVNVSNEGFRTESETRALHILNITLPIQQYSPPNGSTFVNSRFNITLNVSATTYFPNNITIQIFGGNQSSISSEWLLYYNDSVPNATSVIYNWTAPIVRSDNNGLVGLWHMDSRSEFVENATHLYDFSGRNNNGTANGSIPVFPSKFGKGYSFDGNDDYIFIGNDSSLDLTSNFTISFWFNLRSATAFSTLISKKDSIGSEDWLIKFRNLFGNAIHFKKGDASLLVTWFVSAPLDSWHHLVMATENGTNHTLYFDGINYGTVYHNYPIPTGDPVVFGAEKTSYVFDETNGTMDEIAFWNRTLSETEARDLYRLGEGTYYWNAQASDGLVTTQSNTLQFNVVKDVLQANISNLSVIYANNAERVFRFDIINTRNTTTLEDVDWQLNTTQSLIEAHYTTDIPVSKDMIVYVYYNFTVPGTYNITVTAFNFDARKKSSILITV